MQTNGAQHNNRVRRLWLILVCCRQEQRRALQKLEQRASELETQLSDALVDVQRRDATIFELKAALQVGTLFVSPSVRAFLFVDKLLFSIFCSIFSAWFSGKRCRTEHLWRFTCQGCRC
jgi:hypothetical protein